MLYAKKTGNRMTVREVSPDWPTELKTMQTTLLTQNGFLPVTEVGEECIPSRFGMPTKSWAEIVDGETGIVTGYSLTYGFRPNSIRLSQTKLLSVPAIASALQDLMEALQTDVELVEWWCNDMSYVRGSTIAAKAMSVFGLTQEQIETIALSCRERTE